MPSVASGEPGGEWQGGGGAR